MQNVCGTEYARRQSAGPPWESEEPVISPSAPSQGRQEARTKCLSYLWSDLSARREVGWVSPSGLPGQASWLK